MGLKELRKKYADKIKELEKLFKNDMSEDEARSWESLKKECDTLKEDIEKKEEEEARNKEALELQEQRKKYLSMAQRSIVEDRNNPGEGEEPEIRSGKVDAQVRQPYKPIFRNLYDQLKAIRSFYGTGTVDERQIRMEKELRANGMNTQIGEEGAFLIEPQFGGSIFESACEVGQLLNRVTTLPTSSNEVKFNSIKESSIATTVFGGVQAYWASEAGTVTKSDPDIKQDSIKLNKLMAIAYSTEEIEEDTNFVSALYKKAFALAVNRKIEDAIINGTGTGMPKGILTSDGLIEVDKVTGQASGTIVYKNITTMWSRMQAKDRTNSVWLVHPDVEPKFEEMTFPVGTGGVPVFLPAGGLSVDGYSSLRGRPIVPVDLMSSLNSKGDIVLCDLSDYLLLVKEGKTSADNAKLEMSMHVQFLYGENTYRIIFRVGGRPMNQTALTIANSSTTRGKYITLGAR